MTVVYARAGFVARAEMPFIKAGVIWGSSAEFNGTSETSFNSRNAVPATALLEYVQTQNDSFLGFMGAVAYAFEPASPVIADYDLLNHDDPLVYNLPIDQSQIIELIRQELADLQFEAINITYDTLPDPGSFIPRFVTNLQ